MNENLSFRNLDTNVLVSVKSLTHSYKQGSNNILVLDKINFDVKKGEMVGLVGPSGSGKTTLLNLVGLLENAQSGRIILNNDLVNPNKLNMRNNFRRQYIGFIFQSHRLLSNFSARENIAIPQMLQGLTKKIALSRADELLEMVGMHARRFFLPGKLSGGEQQRVAIARGVANNPLLILADEPTGNLDPKSSEIIFDILKKLVIQSKITCLTVTHNLGLANKMDRIFELKESKLNIIK